MADHSKPLTTSTYANFVTELDARFDDLAVGLDPAVTTTSNVPTNAIRWNSAGNNWQKWNGSAWGNLSATFSFPALTSGAATFSATSLFSGSAKLGIGQASVGAIGRKLDVYDSALTSTTTGANIVAQFGSGATAG